MRSEVGIVLPLAVAVTTMLLTALLTLPSTGPAVFGVLSAGGDWGALEWRWKFEGAIFSAVFSMSMVIVVAYLMDLRRKYG